MRQKVVAQALRWIASLILLCSIAKASDALILIRPENAGPDVPAAIADHPTWVLWPLPFPSQTENGLLSIFSGEDWVGNPDYLEFESSEGIRWTSKGYLSLKSIGYLSAKERFLNHRKTCLIADGHGDTSESALLLCVGSEGPLVAAKRFDQVGKTSIVVYQAHSWDDAVFVSDRCGGKCVAIEYPPPTGTRWSRFWMLGPHWKNPGVPSSEALKLTGVVAAKDLVRLLSEGSSLHWAAAGGLPEPWLARTRSLSREIRAWFLGIVFVCIGLGIFFVAHERSVPMFKGFLLLCMGLPALDLLTGEICSHVGESAWIFVITALGFVWLAAANLINMAGQNRKSSSDLGLGFVALIGLLACLLCNSAHSDYSPILQPGRPPVSFEIVGMTGGYFCGLLSIIQNLRWKLFTIILTLGLALACRPDLLPFPMALVIPISVAAIFPASWISGLAAASLPILGREPFNHLCWAPFGLQSIQSDRTGFDVSEYFTTLLSLPVAASLGLGVVAAISSLGFAHHQVSKYFRESPLCGSLLVLAAYLAASGILWPGMFASALTVMLGCSLVLIYRSVG